MTILNLKIDEDKCIHCGLCIKDCMVGVIEFNGNNIPTVAEGGENRCIKCQHCLAVCPTGALSILNVNPEQSEVIEQYDSEALLNLIKSRRSFRAYKNENLDQERMDKLKNMLNWVPTGVNNHRLHFSFVDDVEVMNDVREYTNKKIIELVSRPIADNLTKKFERYKKAILRGNDIIFRGAPHMVVVSSPIDAPCRDIDPMIALSYFELYAQSLGVATCWCGLGYNALNFFPELCKQFEIPEGYKVSYTMLFGPADIKYSRAIQPEPYEMVSVKKGGREMSLMERIRRVFYNRGV